MEEMGDPDEEKFVLDDSYFDEDGYEVGDVEEFDINDYYERETQRMKEEGKDMDKGFTANGQALHDLFQETEREFARKDRDLKERKTVSKTTKNVKKNVKKDWD